MVEYEKSIQQAFREVADLLAARERLGEQLSAQENNRRIQDERTQLFEARYKAQISHYLEVLDARRDLQAAEQGALQARRAVLANAAQLYKALGGAVADETKPKLVSVPEPVPVPVLAPVAAVE